MTCLNEMPEKSLLSLKKTQQHILGLQSCIWGSHKTSGTISYGQMGPNMRFLASIHSQFWQKLTLYCTACCPVTLSAKNLPNKGCTRSWWWMTSDPLLSFSYVALYLTTSQELPLASTTAILCQISFHAFGKSCTWCRTQWFLWSCSLTGPMSHYYSLNFTAYSWCLNQIQTINACLQSNIWHSDQLFEHTVLNHTGVHSFLSDVFLSGALSGTANLSHRAVSVQTILIIHLRWWDELFNTVRAPRSNFNNLPNLS